MSPKAYIAVYYIGLFLFVLFLQTFGRKRFSSSRPLLDNQRFSLILLLFVFCHITFRPLDWMFGDTKTYAYFLERLATFGIPEKSNDIGFTYFSYVCSLFLNVTAYFGLIALVYLLPPYFVFKRAFPVHYFWAFAMFVTSFSFWGYGVNGLRSGMSSSVLLAGFFIAGENIPLVYTRLRRFRFSVKLLRAWGLLLTIFLLAIGFHKSALLPIAAFFLTRFHQRPKTYLMVWVAAVGLSLTVGEAASQYIAGLDIFGEETRMREYLTNAHNVDLDLFYHTGYRWDFLSYSMVPIILGWLYIFKCRYRDSFYIQLFNIYLLTNAFWVVLNQIVFSNRFAYLSWFILPIVMIYPLLMKNLAKAQSQKITIMVLLSYLFTFVMYLRGI